MKPLHRLYAASLLILALSATAFAGEMSTTVAPPQPATNSSVAGEMSTTVTSDSAGIESEDSSALVPVTEAALNVFQTVLSLF